MRNVLRTVGGPVYGVDMLRAVSANLGRRLAAVGWAQGILDLAGDEAVDLLFLQEVPVGADWAGMCRRAGFGLATDSDSTYAVRSMLLWRTSAVLGKPFSLPTAGYHRSYLAAARLDLPGVGEAVAVSVHASPARVTAEHRERWTLAARTLLPEPRPSAGPGELWDSDMVLASLAGLSQTWPILAAGDFNECLAWDDTHAGQWGTEYFARVADANLISLTHRDAAVEQQTAFTHIGLGYQLDHVVASPRVADQIVRPPRVDATWSHERVIAEKISDHAPLWFEIGNC